MKQDEVRICYRCKHKVYPSDTERYPYQCFVHDEDLFSIETECIAKENYLERLSHRLHVTVKEAEKIDRKYDEYISICRVKEDYPVSIEKFYSRHNNEKLRS